MQKLVFAILLSSIKKGARAIRIISTDPMHVYFDLDDSSIEEMRPPGRLRDAMFDLLCEMSGATAYGTGRVTILVGNVRYDWHATLEGNTFRLGRVPVAPPVVPPLPN